MPYGNISSLLQNNIPSGKKTAPFMGEPFYNGDTPVTKKVTLTATVDMGDTTVTVTATTFDLYPNQVINFGTLEAPKYIIIDDYAATGATSLTILPARAAITVSTSKDSLDMYAWIPLIGANSFQHQAQPQEVKATCFNDGGWAQSSVSGYNLTMSVNGLFVVGSPSNPYINDAVTSSKVFYLETYIDNHAGGVRQLTWAGKDINLSETNPSQQNYPLVPFGEPVYFLEQVAA